MRNVVNFVLRISTMCVRLIFARFLGLLDDVGGLGASWSALGGVLGGLEAILCGHGALLGES